MAVEVKVLSNQVMVETAMTNLSINRSVGGYTPGMPGEPKVAPEPTYTVSMGYAESEYLTDMEGKKERVISQGLNPKWINYTQEQVYLFFTLPMKTVEGEDTTLGEFLAGHMDAAILADIEASRVVEP